MLYKYNMIFRIFISNIFKKFIRKDLFVYIKYIIKNYYINFFLINFYFNKLIYITRPMIPQLQINNQFFKSIKVRQGLNSIQIEPIDEEISGLNSILRIN